MQRPYIYTVYTSMSGWVCPSLVAAFGVLPPHGGVASVTGRRFGGPDRGAGIWPGLATASGSSSAVAAVAPNINVAPTNPSPGLALLKTLQNKQHTAPHTARRHHDFDGAEIREEELGAEEKHLKQ
ncbi:hypothetical protein FB451DRAFT_1385849 [Mycena latifolia]|nr:hypothetical protein FB451DRAFT_1385849 [Mycena latifolia]